MGTDGTANECVFCAILAGRIPARVVHADDSTIAFLDLHPVNPGHTLVVPRVHAESLTNLPVGVSEQFWRAVNPLACRIVRALGAQGFNLVLNDGGAAGQVVPHVHMHLIPRFAGDGVHTHPPTRSLPAAEMDDIRRRIAEADPSPGDPDR